jgi:S1-C subfamily serine protease
LDSVAIDPPVRLVIWQTSNYDREYTESTEQILFLRGAPMTRVARLLFVTAVLVSVGTGALAQQFADPEFDAKVDRPAFTDHHPVVLFDEVHNNFHTAAGRYKPFADVLASDGYTVTPNQNKLTSEALKGCTVFVTANAQGAPLMRSPEAAKAAFNAGECDAIYNWIWNGGSLLLIADHHPWGAANESLARRLGVEMGKSMTLDPTNAELGLPGQLNYSRINGLLGDHPIVNGRDGSERIDRVLTFTGQSLKGPNDSVSLLKLSPSAVDQSRPAVPGRDGPARGRAQGLAFTVGRGRVVVLAEAAMLSAQVNGRQRIRMGMNVQGTDNRQFALNVMHWLSGLPFPASPDVALTNPKPALPADATTADPSASKSSESGTIAKSPAMPAAAAASTRSANPGHILSSAEIAAESEPSIAMITGDGSVGTGFLVRRGIIATNAHVVDGEFMTNLRVRFPSAEKAQQGPVLAELLLEDTRRDLAFLRVKTSLPRLRIAPSYTFRKGEDITVIGNPGAGGELILENAISRGLMSTKTSLEGQRYYQLSIAVNPGNSGGPVFNSYGEVIGVVTRKSAAQEALAFSIPIEDLNLAIEKVATLPQDAIDRHQSRHRLILAVKELGGAGALYSSVIALKRKNAANGAAKKSIGAFYDAAITQLEKRTFPKLRAEVAVVRNDRLAAPAIREKVGQLADNLEKLKALYAAGTGGKGAGGAFADLKASHRRLLVDVCKALDLDVPGNILYTLADSDEKGNKGGSAKDQSKKPETPKDNKEDSDPKE